MIVYKDIGKGPLQRLVMIKMNNAYNLKANAIIITFVLQ